MRPPTDDLFDIQQYDDFVRPLLPKIEQAQKIVIRGRIPSVNDLYDRYEHRVVKKDKVRQYEQDFYWQCPLRDRMIDTPFIMYAEVYMATKSKDIDNCGKVLMDSLQRCHAITDDVLCSDIILRKFYDKDNPRVEFCIIPVDI